MFWSVVDPVFYSFILLGTFVVAATLCAPKYHRKRLPMLGLSIFIACIAFVPCCFLVYRALVPFRFGLFHYDNHAAISEDMVSWWISPSASDITVEQTIGGFDAKYSISRVDLEKWLDDCWDNYQGDAQNQRGDDFGASTTPDRQDASRVGWSFPGDATVHRGPYAANWAGFTIWYSDAEGVAYQDAGYW